MPPRRTVHPPSPAARARDPFRRAVEQAIADLGQAFLDHPDNHALRAALAAGTLPASDYFHEIIRLVYRLLFLATVETRGILHPPGAGEEARRRYAERQGVARIWDLARRRTGRERGADLWASLLVTFRGVASGDDDLGLPALGGIFEASRCPSLDAATVDDRALLRALADLARQGEGGDLGRVYEGLLDLVPRITEGGASFEVAPGPGVRGGSRRSTGSYYTPEDLVQEILDRALDPVIAETLARSPERPAEALLDLAIVDPACGSGHFLIAAARRLASAVARARAGEMPSEADPRRAIREVIARCVHGVDLNPTAVDLCVLGLWLEAGEPGVPLGVFAGKVQVGNAILGATAEGMAGGVPGAAWAARAGDDAKTADALRRRNRREARHAGGASSGAPGREAIAADAWCAAFFWPRQPGETAEAAPTHAVWRSLRDGDAAPPITLATVEAIAREHRFFHWHLRFPEVFARGGFDLVIGNPPWIAHGGRASQPLPPAVRSFFEENHPSFGDYRTTHGVFVGHMPLVLRIGGRLALIVPSSISELSGYAAARRAHDRLCDFPDDLVDFGEGRFPGVTQPSMALVSRRSEGGRTDAPPGDPWPVSRPDLSAVDRRLIERLAALPRVPADLFGERGVQSDRETAGDFLASPAPSGRFSCPIREGTDVRELALAPPRIHVDREALGARMRSEEEFRRVRILIRQTAPYPIAALSDGLAFRNSILAGFALPGWPAEALVALLSSALVRWAHYVRFRDARQPVLPQVKMRHLRAIPAPPAGMDRWAAELAEVGQHLAGGAGRRDLDDLVARAYELSAEEQAAVLAWHDRMGPARAAPVDAP